MDKYKCSCCGGKINRVTMTCEYCGTQYKEEYGNLIRIETFTNPVRTLASQMALDNFALKMNPKEYSEYVIKRLATNFAECPVPFMDIHSSIDSNRGQMILDARVKVVEPINKPTDVTKVLEGTAWTD